MSRATPYALVAVGLIGGLTLLSVEPLAPARLNLYAGGLSLAVAVGAVASLIADGGGPGERGPDF